MFTCDTYFNTYHSDALDSARVQALMNADKYIHTLHICTYTYIPIYIYIYTYMHICMCTFCMYHSDAKDSARIPAFLDAADFVVLLVLFHGFARDFDCHPGSICVHVRRFSHGFAQDFHSHPNSIYVCRCLYIYVYSYMYINMYVHVHIHIYAYIQVCLHIYTFTLPCLRPTF